MKLINLFLLLLCLIEIYGQRLRTTNTNQDVSTQEPKTVRGRGRTRFSATQDIPQTSERPSTNRRASTRTRIHSNNPKAAADRRAPTEATRVYAVEEINNDSPIDSFRRQSKPRILTESRFEIPTVAAPRRTQASEPVRVTLQPADNELPDRGVQFGSTARAILQARGEPLPYRTTTPVIDEAYLLNNFGTTIRSLAALRNEVPIQRATPLRSEVPILDREDIPSRRSSLRGDPLPSLRGSDISVERQLPSRGRKNQAKQTVQQTISKTRFDSQRTAAEPTAAQELIRQEPEAEAPQSVQGIFEQSFESVTETEPFEVSSETLLLEEEDLKKTSSAEVVTQRITEPPAPSQIIVNNRRNGARGRADPVTEFEATSSSRTRAPRTRVSQRSEEVNTGFSTRTRSARRRYDDAAVAESRSRGPSVFTAEQYQEVTSRSRTGRRIDSRVENVPERISVDITLTTTIKPRSSGRRATTAAPTSTERPTVRERISSRGRSRSRNAEESTLAPVSRFSNSKRPSYVDDTGFYGDKTFNTIPQTTSRRYTNVQFDTIEPTASISRGSSVEALPNRRVTSSRADTASIETRSAISSGHSVETLPNRSRGNSAEILPNRSRGLPTQTLLNKRVLSSRADTVNSRSKNRASLVDRKETENENDLTDAKNAISSRNIAYTQRNTLDGAIPFGEKSLRTRTQLPQTTTPIATIEEELTTILNIRTKSRYSDVPPKIDESKLEVLPLFERETKTVPSARSRGHRSRSSVNRRQSLAQDHMHVSATENDVKFVEKPTTNAFTRITVTRTESVEASTSRTKLSTRTASPTISTSPTTTETTKTPTSSATLRITRAPETSSTTKKWVTRSPPVIMESVVAEVNQVTSKSTIMRRKKVSKAKANEVLSRGAKKAEVKLTDIGKKKISSEEIDEEDNYPEPFKTLIQAKKKKEESRPPAQSSARSAAAAVKITSTEKVLVTSAASPRGSSTARIVTTELPSPSKRSQLLNEIINDNENELEPKQSTTTAVAPTRPSRLRQLPKFSEKPKYTQKPKEKYTKSTTDKPKYSPEKISTKTTATPRKSYSPKSYSTSAPTEHHSKRKALRSTAFPPSTTPTILVNREAKFSAKFVRKESDNTIKNLKDNGSQHSKRLYSSKRGNEKEGGEEEGRTGRKIDGFVSQTPKPSLPIKKFNSSRYSSRYRGDASQRSSVLRSTTSAPFYIPTIPTPAYIPTVPTIAPSITSVGGFVAEKDNDLGLEVISFDDPVNTIPSADLVNGEYLTTDKNIKLSPMVKDGTTEKPVSIIERIINSITAISTTAVPNITTTNSPSSTSVGATENSAILKLAPKKPTTKDKTIPDDQTNIIETITSEKPTTIIEKIRSSLSAIQSNEVGTSDFNTVSSSSTTPLSTVTKYSAKFRGSSVGTTALPAPLPLSTSINSLNVFDEIDENQVLEKRTIGKLLNILNGLVSTNSPEDPEKIVVVTPKNVLNSRSSPTGFVATTFSSQEPLEAIVLNDIEPRAGFVDSAESSSVSTESSSIVNTETTTSSSIVNTESSILSSIVNTETTTLGSETILLENNDSSTISASNNSRTTLAVPTQTDSFNTETSSPGNIEIFTPISIQTDFPMTSDVTFSTTVPFLTTTSSEASINTLPTDLTTASTNTPQEATTTVKSVKTTTSDTTIRTSAPQFTTNVDGLSSSTIYTFPSTSSIPTIPNIEVSPGSVSIFSANDLSNFITPDDNLFNTVTIASRVGSDNNVLTVTSTTEGITSTTMDLATNTESATVTTTTEVAEMTTKMPSTTTADSTTISTSTLVDTTMLSTTASDESTTMLTTTMSSNTPKSNSSANLPIVSNRSGRILSSDIGELVGNSIEVPTPSTTTSTTPDYFIFAVLNNNTILRKRPPTIPNKDTPFIIVGLYPNNTVVRKFPNGTLIPMEQIIKVRGFDTRPNPPPLVEITSNQVTDTTNGMTTLDNNSVTVDSNRMARLLENDQSVNSFPSRIGISSTTTSRTPSTTSVISTTSITTTNEPEMMTSASSLPSTTSMSSTLMSSTTISENSVPSTTTPGTTVMFTSTLPSRTTSQGTSTTMSSNIIQIMAVPGETRISKAQTTTAEPSTIESSTTQAPTSTIGQSTETIPPTLGEILNGKTVDALANLLSNAEVSTTNAPNFKTLEVNQNSITSTTTVQSTTKELPTERAAPFTSPTLDTESTTQFSNSADTLLSSTLISTLMPSSTTTAESTTRQLTITSTTEPSTTTTTTMRTTTAEIKTTTNNVEKTTQKLQPKPKTTVAPKTTTEFPTFTPSSILPTILTTLFPNLLRPAVTTPSSPLSSTRQPFANAEFSNNIGDRFEVLSTAGTTARPTTVLPPSSTSPRISTTTPQTTTTRQTTTQTTPEPISTTTQKRRTTTKPRATTPKASKSGTPTPSTKEETDELFEQLKRSGRLKNLNEEQRRNLEEIEKIEKEQAELLKQLSVLTTMFGGQAGKLPNLPPLPNNNNPLGGNSNSLANRVIAMAMERDRIQRSSTTNRPQATTEKVTEPTTKRPNSIQDQLPVSQPGGVTLRTTPSLEDVLKQYNLSGLSTPVPLTSTYGKSDEALLAAILKEQGIGPTTPKILGDKVKEAGIFEETPTTNPPKPKPRARATTTVRPIGGRLMQGLNWLLDILDPPTTKRPATKRPKPKTQPPKQKGGEEELLTNQPTRITPVVTAAPVTRPNLSQEEIQILIKQLEAVQADPHSADQLDFSKIKNLQNLINVNEGVQVTSAGQHGATSRATPRPLKITTLEKDPFLKEINKKTRSSTVSTVSVSNSIDDDVELIPSTVRTRVLPPVSLNPIPGIDNQGDSLIRSNLLTAAVNVTRAISSFLGSALQGATRGFRTLIGSGSAMVGNIAQTSNAATG